MFQGENERINEPLVRNKLYPAFLILGEPDFAWSKHLIERAFASIRLLYSLAGESPDVQNACKELERIFVNYPNLSQADRDHGLKLIDSMIKEQVKQTLLMRKRGNETDAQ